MAQSFHIDFWCLLHRCKTISNRTNVWRLAVKSLFIKGYAHILNSNVRVRIPRPSRGAKESRRRWLLPAWTRTKWILARCPNMYSGWYAVKSSNVQCTILYVPRTCRVTRSPPSIYLTSGRCPPHFTIKLSAPFCSNFALLGRGLTLFMLGFPSTSLKVQARQTFFIRRARTPSAIMYITSNTINLSGYCIGYPKLGFMFWYFQN